MIITRHGNGAFRVQSGETAVVVDPEDNRLKADLVLQTGTLLPLAEKFQDLNSIFGPGEYDLKGAKVVGLLALKTAPEAKSFSTVYQLCLEDLRLVFLGNPAKAPDLDLVEGLGEVDILFASPVTRELAQQLEPKITVVTHVKDAKGANKDFGNKIETLEKLTIRKKDLPQHPITVVISE